MPVKVIVDASEIKRVLGNFDKASQWVPRVVHKEMPLLGQRVNFIMREQLSQNRYKGKLERSVEDKYNHQNAAVTIGPTLKFGDWDAGLIAQFGTQKTHVPWVPIKAWAGFRELTPRKASGAWWAIATKGVQKRPFLNETMQRADFKATLEHSAGIMGREIAAQSLVPSGMIGVAITK